MISVTNDGFGLVRVLGPDIAWLIGTTLAIIVIVFIVNWIIGKVGEKDELPHSDIVAGRRMTRRLAFIVWVVVLIGFSWHAATTAASLRIPRSDVDGKSVYQQMDATQGSPR